MLARRRCVSKLGPEIPGVDMSAREVPRFDDIAVMALRSNTDQFIPDFGPLRPEAKLG